MGGFPPLVRKSDKRIEKKVLETRGYSGKDKIASIAEIMNTRKKQTLFLAFGNQDQDELGGGRSDALDDYVGEILDNKMGGHDYNKIVYKELPQVKL